MEKPEDAEVRAVGRGVVPRENHEPRRERKLLLHKREIARLFGKVQEKGFTIVPLRVYIKGNKAKVEIALARGKRQYDKREAIAQRDSERQIQRDWRETRRQGDY